jgi:UDP-GlcNAc3NAcA epimerase
MRTKIVTVLGARPQFIKAAAVSHALLEVAGMEETLVHTGQHFDANMSDVFFDELGIPAPKHNLGIGGGRHGAMTGRQLASIEAVLIDERPDAVLVYGDTNSTLAGALAASKLHIPIAHVEAGLRSFNRRMPEEVNRVLTDHVSHWLFAPTDTAMANLAREGIAAARCALVGDVMLDASVRFRERAREQSNILGRVGVAVGEFVLATVHRAENTDDPARFNAILDALRAVSEQRPVVWPVHPRVRETMAERGAEMLASGRIRLIDPVGYLDMVMLESSAAVVATDSGGVQKEAFFFRVPCVTLRDETEWVELVESGWNRLAPPCDAASVAGAVLGAIGTCGAEVQPYGAGDAASRIAQRLASDLAA